MRAARTRLLLSVRHGKQIMLELCGETLASDYHPRLSALCRAVQLRAQPIGALSECVATQFVALYNLSSHDLAYAVDTACVAAANAANYGFPVWAVVNARGLIKKKSASYLRIRFRPIEAKRYALDLRVDAQMAPHEALEQHAGQGTSLSIALIGRGRADAAEAEEAECVGRSYRMADTIRVGGCAVRLSTERLCFGAVALRCCVRRVVLLHNDEEQVKVLTLK